MRATRTSAAWLTLRIYLWPHCQSRSQNSSHDCFYSYGFRIMRWVHLHSVLRLPKMIHNTMPSHHEICTNFHHHSYSEYFGPVINNGIVSTRPSGSTRDEIGVLIDIRFRAKDYPSQHLRHDPSSLISKGQRCRRRSFRFRLADEGHKTTRGDSHPRLRSQER